MIDKKAQLAVEDLRKRDHYKIVQGNSLARAFGNLTAFEQKLLDFCFTFVQKDDQPEKTYKISLLSVLRSFGLNRSGASYKRTVSAFSALNAKTALYLNKTIDGQDAIVMTSLFSEIAVLKNGEVQFSFNKNVAPYVFQLRQHYYSFHLADLSQIRSKYALTLLKLWNANSIGTWDNKDLPSAVIQGSVSEWESWMLGTNEVGEPKHWSAGIFKRNVLKRAINELEKRFPNVDFALETTKNGVAIAGYRLTITPIHTTLNA